MSIIYLSGPISHYDYSERKKTFLRIQQELERKGHEVFNPMFNGLPKDASTHEHMRVDFQMLLQCDTILMLPKWNHSAGCAQLSSSLTQSLSDGKSVRLQVLQMR